MAPIILPASSLQRRYPRAYRGWAADFAAHHRDEPTEETTLRAWFQAVRLVEDWHLLCAAAGSEGLTVSLGAFVRTVARVMGAHPDEGSKRAVKAARHVLAGYRRGLADDVMQRRREAARQASVEAPTVATAYAAYVASEPGYAHIAAAQVAAHYKNRAQQRADLLAALDDMETM